MPHRLPHHPVHRHSWAGLSDRRWRREPSGSSVTPCETAHGREKCGAETGLLKRMRVAHQGDLRCRRYWLQMSFVPDYDETCRREHRNGRPATLTRRTRGSERSNAREMPLGAARSEARRGRCAHRFLLPPRFPLCEEVVISSFENTDRSELSSRRSRSVWRWAQATRH